MFIISEVNISNRSTVKTSRVQRVQPKQAILLSTSSSDLASVCSKYIETYRDTFYFQRFVILIIRLKTFIGGLNCFLIDYNIIDSN